MKFRLEGDSQDPIASATWHEIENALDSLHPRDRCFFSLTDVDTGSYVQVAGARLRLSVEGRLYTKNSFRHFVFGRPERNGRVAYINCKVGPIHVVASQVLALDDAKPIFRHFHSTGAFPDGYEMEDVTKRMSEEHP